MRKAQRYVTYIVIRSQDLTNDQLGHVTVDKASNNVTMCEKVGNIHQKHGIVWNHKEHQLLYVGLQLFDYPQCLIPTLDVLSMLSI